jgi:hypothetical protein
MKAMFYGDPGTTKTSTAASCQDHPAMRDVMVLNVEGGLMSVVHRGDIRAIDITESGQVEEFFWKMVKQKELGKGRYSNIKTVVLDNATEFQSINVQELVAEAHPEERDEVYRDDWGKSTIQIKRVFRWFRQAPVNFIATAHVRKTYPKNAKGNPNTNVDPISITPALTPSLSEALLGYMDFVWYFFREEKKVKGKDKMKMTYNILTQPEDIYFAKTRGPRFAEAMGKVHRIPKDKVMSGIYDMYLSTFNPQENK